MNDPRKQALIDALDKFVNQRSGLEFANYGDAKSFRSEQRSITKDLHDYRALRAQVESHGTLAADMILDAQRAFSGRLSFKDISARYDDGSIYYVFKIEYCTGQYFPTEYRKAACAVLASALWEWTREHAMPTANSWRVESWSSLSGRERSKPLEIHAACELLAQKGGQQYGHVQEYIGDKTPGDWLRSHFARQLGRGIARHWFN